MTRRKEVQTDEARVNGLPQHTKVSGRKPVGCRDKLKPTKNDKKVGAQGSSFSKIGK